MKILIVEDDYISRDVLQKTLQKAGYETFTAEDGLEALKIFHETPFSLIISDWMMPNMDGVSLCKKIREISKHNYVYFIILTVKDKKEDLIEAFDAGADDFISKPFDRDELLAKIRSLLRQKRHHEKQEKSLKEQLECSLKDLEQTRLELTRAEKRIAMLERAKDQLSKFVPASVREMAEEDPETYRLQKVETDATVLFLDIGGYSRMCESLNDEKVNFLVEKYFSEFLDDVRKGNGEINETAGDGLMIIFKEKDREAHARTAVSTAIGIHYKTLKVNAELRGKFDPTVVNMGINSGKVFLGATRFEGMSSARWTFTASGLTTVLAARLAGLATEGEVLLGPETVNRLKEEFLVQPFGEHHLKNISNPVPVYRLVV